MVLSCEIRDENERIQYIFKDVQVLLESVTTGVFQFEYFRFLIAVYSSTCCVLTLWQQQLYSYCSQLPAHHRWPFTIKTR